MEHIAFLGLGRMGAPMAQRLLAAGHQLTVWNRTAARAEPLISAGAHAAGTPAEAVAGAGVVISMLADPAAVEDVLLGPDGAGPALRRGATLVEMSTVGPEAVRKLAARLPAGVTLLDAPVMGSTPRAESGELTILAGGVPAPAVEAVLEAMGTVLRCGELGSGAALKLVANTAMITALAALGEALVLAEDLGVQRESALRALAGGPLAGVVQRARDTRSRFPVAHAAKDLRLAGAARAEPVLPLLAGACAHLGRAMEKGAGDADLRAVLEHIR